MADKSIPNEVVRDKDGKAQGITARCPLCSWSDGGYFSGMSASAAKQDHMEAVHGKPSSRERF